MDTKLLSTGIRHNSLPETYIRPEPDRPRLSEVSSCENVPVINLGCGDRARIAQEIAFACMHFGFFQVINHGVPVEAMEKMLGLVADFFNLPVEEKLKLYSDDPSKTPRLSTSFSLEKEKVHNWRDYLRLHCYPLEKYMPGWLSNPPSFKDIVSQYCKEVRGLGFKTEELISESLGLDKDNVKDVLGEDQGQHMVVNFYPPCPRPDLTYGIPSHTDPNVLTILLQDSRASGLQILKDGKWLTVDPIPGAFVINIGDQLQALSNGKYKSVWHRAVVNEDVPRISVAVFLCPADHVTISPPKALVKVGGLGAVYRDFTYAEYYGNFLSRFWSQNLDPDHLLELFRNE